MFYTQTTDDDFDLKLRVCIVRNIRVGKHIRGSKLDCIWDFCRLKQIKSFISPKTLIDW